MKSLFVKAKVLQGIKVIHEEIVKITDVKEEDFKDTPNMAFSLLSYRLKKAMLETLFARDSMSMHSRVRPIRERMDEENKAGIFGREVELIPEGGELLYKEQMEGRDPYLGYMFDEPIKHHYLF